MLGLPSTSEMLIRQFDKLHVAIVVLAQVRRKIGVAHGEEVGP